MTGEELLAEYRSILPVLRNIVSEQAKLDDLRVRLTYVEKNEKEIREGVNWFFVAIGAIAGVVGAIIGAAILSVIGGILGLLLGFFGVVLATYSENTCNQNNKADIYHHETVAPLLENIRMQENIVSTLWNSPAIVSLESLVPPEYRSVEPLSFFVMALENKRAETKEELFNLYEEHLKTQSNFTYNTYNMGGPTL